ncbi:hypothetical protein DMA11_19210 [Marinilabiliaceae bacterium JC017]|nr:hypothetical protein DMA11_19210 [Marinilabiliaceae bacterium JC017]
MVFQYTDRASKKTKNMKLENKKQSFSVAVNFALIIVALIILLAVYYITDLITLKGVDYVLWGLLVVVLLLYKFGGFYYLLVEEKKQVLDIKYYGLFPLGRSFKRLSIPVDALDRIEVKEGVGGMFSRLVLYQKSGTGVAKYPAIGLAAMRASMRRELKAKLTALSGK